MKPKQGLFMEITPDGPIPVLYENGEKKYLPVPTVDYKEPPEGFTEEHQEVMLLLAELVEKVKTHPKRLLPVTRFEMVSNGVPARLLKELIDFKMIKSDIIMVDDERTGKPTGSRSVVYFTPRGHAHMKEKYYGQGKKDNVEAVSGDGKDI